jgi:hypothetical protein
MAKRNTETTTTDEAEYDRGYAAFMLRCGSYALAHAAMYDGDQSGRDWWKEHHQAGQDDQPETEAYREGYAEAQERMHREIGLSPDVAAGFGAPTPRALTAMIKLSPRPRPQLVIIEGGRA